MNRARRCSCERLAEGQTGIDCAESAIDEAAWACGRTLSPSVLKNYGRKSSRSRQKPFSRKKALREMVRGEARNASAVKTPGSSHDNWRDERRGHLAGGWGIGTGDVPALSSQAEARCGGADSDGSGPDG